MGNCSKEINKLKRSDCVASEKSGFKPFILLALFSDIVKWCTFGNNTTAGFSTLEKKVLTKGDIELTAGKFWQRVESSELGMIKVSTKKAGNAFMTELKQRLQNSLETRGFLTDIPGSRLVALVFETDGALPVLLGHSDGYFAEFKKDGADVEFGEKYEDDKYADIVLEYKPLMPYNYTGVYLEAAPVV